MFLKKIVIPNKKTGQPYQYYRLCESYRIEDKTRHRNLLNVGKLSDLDETQRKLLADRIEEMIKGSISLFTNIIGQKVEKHARHFYSILKNRKLISVASQKRTVATLSEDKPDWEEVFGYMSKTQVR